MKAGRAWAYALDDSFVSLTVYLDGVGDGEFHHVLLTADEARLLALRLIRLADLVDESP